MPSASCIVRRASILVACLGLAACGGPPESAAPPVESSGVLEVAVTVAPHAWLVEQIGGERVEVAVAVAPGESPETFQPSDAEASRLLRARLYFRAGVAAERGAWFDALSRSGGPEIVDLRRGVELEAVAAHGRHHRPSHGQSHGAEDPHTWLSPRRLAVQAQTVTEALLEADPDGADDYRRRLEALRSQLETLDADLRRHLEPWRGRSFLVFHPAWGYLAADYGLRQVAIEIEGKDPSESELTAIQQQARSSGLRVVFVQPQISGRAAAAVASALGGRLETLDPLARDVPAGLREAAEKLASAFEDAGETAP